MKLRIKHDMLEIVRGKTQYPNMQMLWKNEMVPPNNCALTVTAAAPHHTITKTAAKTREAESPGAVKLSTEESNKQTSKGPHRSPKMK